MTTPPVRIERRAGQRFSYLLPVSLRNLSGTVHAMGFTQDLSARGVFFFTDAALTEGSEIELGLRMPSEITLGESMRVRCRGRVLRIVNSAGLRQRGTGPDVPAETRIGVAVRFDSYEYLSDINDSLSVPRVATLHPREGETNALAPASPRPAQS
jgi:hypothetical protein